MVPGQAGFHYNVPEGMGVTFLMTGPARYHYHHGIEKIDNERISVSWRWFQDSFITQMGRGPHEGKGKGKDKGKGKGKDKGKGKGSKPCPEHSQGKGRGYESFQQTEAATPSDSSHYKDDFPVLGFAPRQPPVVIEAPMVLHEVPNGAAGTNNEDHKPVKKNRWRRSNGS